MPSQASSTIQPPCMVLLHGALNDHSVWAPQVEVLAARGITVLTPDLPGHGSNPAPALESIEQMAAWLLALLDTEGIAQAMLVGHSMGSLIALEAACQSPGRVKRLALLGSAWPMAVAPSLLETALHDEPAAIAMVTKWSHAPGTPAAITAATQGLMERMATINPAHLLHTDLHACSAYANGEAAARSIDCPTLLIVGTLDKMTPPRSNTRLAAAIPHAGTVEVAAGHQMMAEQPEAVSVALLDFALAS